MGIRNLNNVIRKHCNSTLLEWPMARLSGKTIVVDVLSYLYQFKSDDSLIGNTYILIMLFRKYSIDALYIFDGLASSAKKKCQLERFMKKKSAEDKCRELENQIATPIDICKQRCLSIQLANEKKKCVRLTKLDKHSVMQLMDACGVSYLIADGEADAMCVKLVETGKAFACLSEDMDMIAYGCPKVLRCLNLMTSSLMLYDTKEILRSMNITVRELTDACIISGTDYNREMLSTYKVFQLLMEFKNTVHNSCFAEWIENEKIIDMVQYQTLISTRKCFNTDSYALNLEYESCNKPVDTDKLAEILTTNDFIIPNGTML